MYWVLPQSLHRTARLRPPTALFGHRRYWSSKTHYAHIIKVDLDPSSSSQPDSPEAAAEVVTLSLGIQKLEEAIHSIIVHRAAPSWLPFLPGYSYWVPPRAPFMAGHSAGSLMEVVGSLVDPANRVSRRGSTYDSLSEDGQVSLNSRIGWPSSAFFLEGTSLMHPVTVVEVELKIHENEQNTDDTPNSEEEQ